MLDKLDAALRFQQEALNLRAQRQEILAANIANADTPGFQARDIDFSSELKKVMERGRAENSGVALALTSARHIPAETVTTPNTDLLYRIRISHLWTVTPSIWIGSVRSSLITVSSTRWG